MLHQKLLLFQKVRANLTLLRVVPLTNKLKKCTALTKKLRPSLMYKKLKLSLSAYALNLILPLPKRMPG